MKSVPDRVISDFYRTMTSRVGMLLGPDVMERIAATRVIIFGTGGVGSWCAESLIRTGILSLTIVDSDTVCPTNINRQIQATSLNTGESKVDELRKRLVSVNPEAEITAIHRVYDETSCADFNLSAYDYVIDAIDSLKNKILLLEECIKAGVKFYASMGAAAKTDPSKIKAGPLSDTKNCPLARLVRRGLRQRSMPVEFICVYSDELPRRPIGESFCGTGDCACVSDSDTVCESVDWCSRKKRVNGALVHITAVFGFNLAGLVINDIIKSSAGE